MKSHTKTLQTPAQDLLIGTLFAERYKIIEELGRGGMGVVYKAEDTKLKRTVALKFLPSELTHIPEIKERFMREAQAAAALDHPNICTVHEFDEADDKTYITMAYIEGQNLRKKTEVGALALDEALSLAAQVAEGLQEAHHKGVIHRDIKSANIMVTEKNQAKIMDFGLARMSGGTLLTREGMAMGTVAYMSPEQAQGKEVDLRTDIWSLGVVLYEMFSGQLPFKGEHEQSVVRSILNDKPKAVSDLRSEIPESLSQVVNKALEKSPDERYQQVDELLDDLKSISAGIVPDEIKVRLRKATLRKRKRVISYAGIAGLIITAAIIAFKLFMGPPVPIESIAVLPLENLTGDGEREYFVNGITDELIGQLGQISGLKRVISRTSVMKYKDTDKSMSEIARELNVDAVVEGSVQQAGDTVRVRLQLIDVVPEEQNLWGDTYERASKDVLIMCSEMARTIADEIRVELTNQEEAHLASARQVDQKAYDVYLKGLFHLYKFVPPELETARQYFETALEIDPNYAEAQAGIAMVWVSLQQMGVLPSSEATPKAKEALRKAQALDGTLAEVYFVEAIIKTWSDWDWEGGEASYRRALEINPNYPEALVYYSNLLCYMGRPDEALARGARAMELDPFSSSTMTMYGCTLAMLGMYEEALVQHRNAIKTSPNDPVARSSLWEILHFQGRYEEALDEARAFFTGLDMAPLIEIMEQGYAKDGYFGAMRSVAETMEAFSQETYVSPWYIGYLYGFAREKEKTLEWLEKAYEEKNPMMPYLKYVGELQHFLLDDPQFQDLLRRMNLPDIK